MASRWKPSTRTWGQKAYDEVMAKYPEIGAPSVALCVWAYAKDRNTTIENLRELAATDKDVGKIGGRAQGSARQVLGLAPKAKGRGKVTVRKSNRGPGRPKKAAPATGMQVFLHSIKEMEKERDDLRRVLDKIRAALDSAP